jgi:hypothetical protein
VASSLLAKANTCATADSLSTSGSLVQATFSGTEHWFMITTAKPIPALYGHWWQNQRAPKTIQVYAGTCSSLTLLYTQQFDTIADTTNQFVNAFAAGTYYIKVIGFDGNKIGIALGIENIGDNCASPGCNLVPNFSFKDHPALSAPIPWGVFTPWVDCWANASSNLGATPDYALDPNPACAPVSGNGNRCIATTNYEPWPKLPAQHATAHIFVSHVPNPNRREFILTNLQDNNGVTTLEANRTYYVSLRVRNNPNMGWYNDALGIMFTEQLWIDPNNAVYSPPTGIDRVYHSFTGANSTYNNTLWRQCSGIIQNNSIPKTHLVIGNFEDNATTAGRMLAGNPNAVRDAANLATIYIDHVEVLAMPDAGDDITVCAGDSVTLGWQPNCLPAGVTYQWWDALYTTLLGTTPNLTIAALPGQTTYLLQVTFDGQTFFTDVTVTGLPAAHLSASITNQNYCNGDFTFTINDFDPTNMNYSYTLNGLQATGHFDGNGGFTVGQLEFTSTLGMATVTITATNQSSNCTKSQTFTVYDCCNAQPNSVAVLNDAFTKYNQGTAGMDYSIYGSVTLDDNYTFTDCHFYLQPDAELVALADLTIEFINCTFEACTDYKWDRIHNPWPTTSLTFTDCQITEGLRALHTENDAQLSLNGTLFADNTLSQLVHSYTSSTSLSWQGNTYNMYPLNLYTQQHPLSAIAMGSILNLTNYNVVGIKFDEAQNFILANSNTFWADFSVSFDNYLHVWLTQNSTGSIDGNTFNEGMNMYIEQASTAIITNNTFQKSAQANGAPGGIYAHGSTVTVGDENATSTSNYMYDGASVRIEEPVQTEIYHNIISHNTLSEAVKVTAASTISSRTRIQYNEITAKTCILLQNLFSNWQSSSNQKVYVNFNDLYPTKTSNTTGNGNIATGVSAYNCEGVSIGENTITHVYTTGVTLPNATNNYQSVGIQLTNSRNAFVGCNEISYAGRGLSLSGNVKKDTWNTLANGHPVNFQSNEFNGNYHGIYLEIGSQIPHFGEATLAADNRWLQAIGFNTGRRVQDDRVNINPTDYFDYYFSGSALYSNPNYPEETLQNYSHLFEKITVANPQCSIVVPSNKRIETEDSFNDQLIIYPNPTSDMLWITINSSIPTHQIAIYTITGQLIWIESNPDNQIGINVVDWPKGVYVVRVYNEQKINVQRFVVK